MFQRRLSLARSRASRLNDSIFAQVAIRIGLALLLLAGVLSVTVGPLAAQDRKSDDKPTFYDPVERNIEGWTIAVDPLLLEGENKELGDQAMKALANHLQRITYIVPEKPLTQLKTMRIWLELNNPVLGNMQYHPGKGWLVNNGHDPRLVKHVHIPRARQLLDRHMWAKHPYVVLHELAHAYHDQILDFQHAEVLATYKASKEAGIYDEVLLYTGQKVRHYGLNNQMEYFAESTEAYFGVNDFYPFVRAELKEHDPRMFTQLENIWGPVK
ncbi:MAG: metallopeptidase [Planctomycetota bacterium]|nr:metallopeptidase [Planctomycetota bacterium]